MPRPAGQVAPSIPSLLGPAHNFGHRPETRLSMRRSLALAVGLLLGATLLSGPAHAAPTTGFRFVNITASDSVVLKANVIEPTTAGRHPAIIFPSSWGLNDLEYVAQAT